MFSESQRKQNITLCRRLSHPNPGQAWQYHEGTYAQHAMNIITRGTLEEEEDEPNRS